MNSDLLTDAILAMAISDHDGSVQLLLPVLRQQTWNLLIERDEKDFALAVHSLVAGVAADPRYAPAFSQEPESRTSLPSPSSTPSPSTPGLIWTMSASIMLRLRELSGQCVAYVTTCYRRVREIGVAVDHWHPRSSILGQPVTRISRNRRARRSFRLP
jgi:hypothetical protein